MTQAEISREMDVTRQTVNKTFDAISSRVSRALLETAQVNKVEISRLDPKRGFLMGCSPSLGMDVLVTFSDRNGILVGYRGAGDCSKCSWLNSCMHAGFEYVTEMDGANIFRKRKLTVKRKKGALSF